MLICETVQICWRAQPTSPFTGELLQNYCIIAKRKTSVAKVAKFKFLKYNFTPIPSHYLENFSPGCLFLYFLQHLLLLLIKFLSMIKLRKILQKLNNVLSSSNLHYKNTKRHWKQHLYYCFFPHICLKQAFWRWCSPCHKLNFTLFWNSNSLCVVLISLVCVLN